jgi:hypothetical protein
MPKGEYKEQGNYPIPAEELVPVRLDSVEVKQFRSKDRQTKQPLVNDDGSPKMYDRWEWTFKVSDGDYKNIKITHLTVPFVSPADGNEPRQWAETLLGLDSWEPGRGLDTDDLLGLPAVAEIGHDAPRQRGDGKGMWYGMHIASLFPASALAEPAF